MLAAFLRGALAAKRHYASKRSVAPAPREVLPRMLWLWELSRNAALAAKRRYAPAQPVRSYIQKRQLTPPSS